MTPSLLSRKLQPRLYVVGLAERQVQPTEPMHVRTQNSFLQLPLPSDQFTTLSSANGDATDLLRRVYKTSPLVAGLYFVPEYLQLFWNILARLFITPRKQAARELLAIYVGAMRRSQ